MPLKSAAQTRLDEAVKLHQQGQLDAAQAIYEALIAQSPDDPAPLHLLGTIRLQQGDASGALERIGQAIALDANKAVYFNNYGAALHSLQRHVEALACFHRAAAIRPEYADALSNLGMAYESLGQLDTAAEYFRKALAIAPKHPDARRRYLALVHKQGNAAEVIRLSEEDLADNPSAELHQRLGNLLLSEGKSLEAMQHYEQALVLDPNNAVALLNLGNALHEQHRVPEAKEVFGRAAGLKPEQPLWRLRAEVSCPAVFQSTQEIDDFREKTGQVLDQFRDSPPAAKWQDLVYGAAFPNFTYSYLGRNVRPLKEKFAALYQHYFRDVPEPQGSGLAGKRRIGIVVTHRHEGIFLRCMTGVLQGLSLDLFELVLLCSPSGAKVLREGLGIPGLRIVTFGNQLEEAASIIRETKCDVLHYWEAGSDALNYFLPFCRLAPVQSTSHGTQITSGNPAVDFFYSSRLMEAATAQDHYTERLWLSDTLLMNQPRLPPSAPAERSKFGLPDDKTLYLCLQNPLKLHPDFDPLLAGVLRGEPRGVVVLLKGAFEFAEADLRRRFVRTMPDVQDRLVFLPYQKFPDYCSLLLLGDVALDTVHFGHGSSAYDVFSFNLPLVTFPTALNVGRVGTACYTKMELPDLVAKSAEDYIGQAVRLGTDADYRRHTVERLAAATHKLFDDQRATDDHQLFFGEMARSPDAASLGRHYEHRSIPSA